MKKIASILLCSAIMYALADKEYRITLTDPKNPTALERLKQFTGLEEKHPDLSIADLIIGMHAHPTSVELRQRAKGQIPLWSADAEKGKDDVWQTEGTVCFDAVFPGLEVSSLPANRLDLTIHYSNPQVQGWIHDIVRNWIGIY